MSGQAPEAGAEEARIRDALAHGSNMREQQSRGASSRVEEQAAERRQRCSLTIPSQSAHTSMGMPPRSLLAPSAPRVL